SVVHLQQTVHSENEIRIGGSAHESVGADGYAGRSRVLRFRGGGFGVQFSLTLQRQDFLIEFLDLFLQSVDGVRRFVRANNRTDGQSTDEHEQQGRRWDGLHWFQFPSAEFQWTDWRLSLALSVPLSRRGHSVGFP